MSLKHNNCMDNKRSINNFEILTYYYGVEDIQRDITITYK